MSKSIGLLLSFGWILTLTMAPSVVGAEESTACDEARPMAISWLRLTAYLEKLEQGGWSEPEIAYVNDAVREREGDLREVGLAFARGADPADKALGTSLEALHAEIAKREGRDLVDDFDAGRLEELVAALDRVSTRCPAPKVAEDDEGEDEPKEGSAEAGDGEGGQPGVTSSNDR